MCGGTTSLEGLHFCTFNTISDFPIGMSFSFQTAIETEVTVKNDLNVKSRDKISKRTDSVVACLSVCLRVPVALDDCNRADISRTLTVPTWVSVYEMKRWIYEGWVWTNSCIELHKNPPQHESGTLTSAKEGIQRSWVNSWLKGLCGVFGSADRWAMKQQTLRQLDGKNTLCFDENVASCMFDTILYYWYDSCKVFFLNNWIIYYCLCYLSVSQTWTKTNSPPPPHFILFS